MTDLAGALADTSALGSFDGKQVLKTTIAVTNAGDGLSEALKVEPQLLHLDGIVYVVLACRVDKIRFEPIKDVDGVSRVHVLKAGAATLVDEDLVKEHLTAQAERILQAKEKAAGIERIPFGDELQDAHQKGEHDDGLIAGCPDCEALAAARGETIPDPSPTPEGDPEDVDDPEVASPTPIGGRRRAVKDSPQA